MPHKQLPFWFALLEAYCADKVGPTIPYLVGASAIYHGKTASVADAKSMLSEMMETQYANTSLIFSFCNHIQAPVVSLFHDYGTGVRFSLPNEWGSNDRERVRKLLLNAAEPIQQGNFSRIREGNDRSWKTFQEEELQEIRSVIRAYTADSD